MKFDNKETKKECKKCGRVLPLNEFKVINNCIQTMCKECFNKRIREKRLQQKIENNLQVYYQDKSMKIERKYKKIYSFQVLDESKSGIPNISIDEVFVRLFDYKSTWISNYDRVIQQMEKMFVLNGKTIKILRFGMMNIILMELKLIQIKIYFVRKVIHIVLKLVCLYRIFLIQYLKAEVLKTISYKMMMVHIRYQ